jgi:hypothetical protein
LIHRHRPDLIDYNTLNKDDALYNMTLAFDVAEQQLGIPKLFSPEDVVNTEKPDERSILTYVAQYFHAFSALDKVGQAGRRVERLGQIQSQAWAMKHDFEKRIQELMAHSVDIQGIWSISTFTGYPDAKRQLQEFETYKSSTKRDWVTEKRNLEAVCLCRLGLKLNGSFLEIFKRN